MRPDRPGYWWWRVECAENYEEITFEEWMKNFSK